MPGAVEIAMQEDVEFRKGLPINYLLHNGIAFDGEVSCLLDRMRKLRLQFQLFVFQRGNRVRVFALNT